jgi:hypothetical protein
MAAGFNTISMGTGRSEFNPKKKDFVLSITVSCYDSLKQIRS